MAQGYLGLDISSQSIRFVFLAKQGSHYVVTHEHTEECFFDPHKAGALTKKIKDYLASERLSPQKIVVSLSLSDLLVRDTLLPKIKPKEWDEVISGEIDKIHGFSQKEYDYTWYAYPGPEPNKSKVVFAAVDQQIIDYIIEEVRNTKISFQQIEVTPLNIKELIYQSKPSERTIGVLLVHDQLSYFLVVQDRQIKFLYKANTGSAHLRDKATPSLIPYALKSFVSEIERVLKSFQNEGRKDTVEKIFCVYDKSMVPNLVEQLGGLVSVPLAELKLDGVSRNIKVKEGTVENPMSWVSLYPVLSELLHCKDDFSSHRFFRHQQAHKKVVALSLLGMFIMFGLSVVLGLLALNFSQRKDIVDREMEQVNEQISTLQRESTELFAKRDEYLLVREGLLQQATYVKMLNRVSWAEVLSIVAEDMPEQLALTQFEFFEGGKVSFEGDSLQLETISEMIREVDSSQKLTGGKFDFLKESKEEEIKIFEFGVFAELRSETDLNKSLAQNSEPEGKNADGRVQ